MAEQVFRAATPITGRVTPASFPFYTSGEDNLRLLTYNSAPQVHLKVNARLLDNDGRPKPQSWDATPNTDRTLKIDEFTLSGLTLLNVTVFASIGLPQIGQTFIVLQLIRGSGLQALVLGTILQGYVTAIQGLGWPGSPIQNASDGQPAVRLVNGTTPGLGAEINEVVPTGARWRLVYFQGFLTTSAEVFDRAPRLSYNTGTPAFIHLPVSGVLAASKNKYFAWSEGCALDSDHSGNVSSGNLPNSAILTGGQSIATNTENLRPGDQWSLVTYGVEERLDVP